jgi:hypothetical protein
LDAAEQRRHRGHQDRSETQRAGLVDRFLGRQTLGVFDLLGKIDQHDAVFLDNADEQYQADDRDHAQIDVNRHASCKVSMPQRPHPVAPAMCCRRVEYCCMGVSGTDPLVKLSPAAKSSRSAIMTAWEKQLYVKAVAVSSGMNR